MRPPREEALGLIETLGMAPAVYGADAMLKAADVRLAAFENVGSTLVTVAVQGEVAAARAAVEAGRLAAASVGKLTAYNVMPRPIQGVRDVASVHALSSQSPGDATQSAGAGARPGALGLVETFGLVFLLEAADAMGKAADVELIGYENVASGYISALIRGDAAACRAAVDAGVRAVRAMGADVYSAVSIPAPHPEVETIIRRYRLDNLLPGDRP